MKYSKEREKVSAFLNDKLMVRQDLEPIDISEGINWNYQHKNNAGTYQTYIHDLGIINALLIISIEDNYELLQKYARDIILEWYSIDHTKFKNYAWNEHPVSSRINYIIDFQNTSENFKLPEDVFEELITTHCDFLFTEKNYRFNNHGLMMDYALLNAANYIKNKELKTVYVEKVLYRVRYALRRDFSKKGVHLENSPEYHHMVLNIYRKIERKLKEIKVPLGKQETEILTLAQNYKSYIIQPNQIYPIIGDTGNFYAPKISKNFKNFYDNESSMCIVNNLNEKSPEKSTMLTFKSGYFNKTHKHYDDLSVTLFMDGLELLVDSGKYSYNSKDLVRQHIISPEGHNTINIIGKNYELENPIQEQFKLKLTGYRSKKDYVLSSGINNLYNQSNLTRYNVLTKDNVYIVLDRVVSKNIEKVQQNFNINENATINKINELTYEIHLENETFIVKTFERFDTSVTSGIEKGYVSRRFGKYKENRRIVLSQNTKNATFITAIFNKKNESKVNDISLRNNKIVYSINEEKVTIDL